jgi:tyrosinase
MITVSLRKSIRNMTDTEKDDLINALLILKHERIGPDGLSTYDRYVVQHNKAMIQPSLWSPGLDSTLLGRYRFTSQRNAAHRSATFLPWHREFLRRLESDIKRVLGDSDFGLPYWDWEHDGALSQDDQRDTSNRDIWKLVGGDGIPDLANMVTTGPFGFDPNRLSDSSVFNDNTLWLTVDDRGRQTGFLQRALGREEMPVYNLITGDLQRDTSGQTLRTPILLPKQSDIDLALNIPDYDRPNWDENPNLITSFRNVLEGWAFGPFLHNRVHMWVGGSMGPGTSPNDPVFFLHHCNVDRIWTLWQKKHTTSAYAPSINGPTGQNFNDAMYPWDGTNGNQIVTPSDVWDLDDVEYVEPLN